MQYDRKLPTSQRDVLHPPSFTSEDGGPLISMYQRMWRYIPENINFNNRLRENLKSHMITV